MTVHEERFLVGCASSDGHVFWYCTAPVKLEGAIGTVPQHEASCVCAEFLFSVPLMVTGDVDGCLVFHALKPFVPYEVLHRAKVSEPGLTCILVGREEKSLACSVEGTLVCCDISSIVNVAAELFKEISAGGKRNTLTEAERELLPKELPVLWSAQAHKGSIDALQTCGTVLFSLGIDCVVRMWAWESGESLGALSATAEMWKMPPLPPCEPPPEVEELEYIPKGTAKPKMPTQPTPLKVKSKSTTSLRQSEAARLSNTKKTVHQRAVRQLDSGLKRVPRFDSACKASADRLAQAFAAVGDSSLAKDFQKF